MTVVPCLVPSIDVPRHDKMLIEQQGQCSGHFLLPEEWSKTVTVYGELMWSSGTAQDSESVGCEFEPPYGQRVMSLGKTFPMLCLQEYYWEAMRGTHNNLSADRLCAWPVMLSWNEMTVMVSCIINYSSSGLNQFRKMLYEIMKYYVC